MNSDVRNDLHLTATGIGHAYRPGHGFPPPGFRVRISFLNKVIFYV